MFGVSGQQLKGNISDADEGMLEAFQELLLQLRSCCFPPKCIFVLALCENGNTCKE